MKIKKPLFPMLDNITDDIFCQLSRPAIRTVRQLFRLFRYKSETIALQYATITPSLEYISGQARISYYEASRATSELARFNIIVKKQKRKRSGRFGYNIYKLSDMLIETYRALRKGKKPEKTAGCAKTQTAIIDKDKNNNNKEKISKIIEGICGKLTINNHKRGP